MPIFCNIVSLRNRFLMGIAKYMKFWNSKKFQLICVNLYIIYWPSISRKDDTNHRNSAINTQHWMFPVATNFVYFPWVQISFISRGYKFRLFRVGTHLFISRGYIFRLFRVGTHLFISRGYRFRLFRVGTHLFISRGYKFRLFRVGTNFVYFVI